MKLRKQIEDRDGSLEMMCPDQCPLTGVVLTGGCGVGWVHKE